MVDPGGEGNGSNRTLVEAARAERERRAKAGPPVAVINDKNLKSKATGHLTVMEPKRPAQPAEAKPAEATSATAGEEVVKDEAYWKGRALEIRQRWRRSADEVAELEQSAAGWRRRFYAENDRYVRDGQIKPEWDRVLDRLEIARAEVETAKKELAEFLEEGRVAGAFPGWLREGADLEPETRQEPSNEHRAIEPPVVDEDGNE